jgi:predicted PurR-regulated permease PerM
MNAIDLLKADHARVQELFRQYDKAGAQQREIAEQIFTELEMHATLEEELFYPALRGRVEPVAAAAEETEDEDETTADAIRSRLADEMGTVAEHLFSFLTSTTAVLGGVLFTLFIAIYLAVSADTYRRGLLLLVPASKQGLADEVMGETATMLRRWLSTQLVAMVVVGFFTTLILLLLGVPAALALGILAGLMEFVPIFGPIIAAIPAIAMAFLVSPQTALYVLIAYVVLQQLESQLLVPMLMEKGVDLPPLLTVVIQALMALVFGFIGLLVAVPLLATVMVAVKILYLREILGREVHLPSDASLST